MAEENKSAAPTTASAPAAPAAGTKKVEVDEQVLSDILQQMKNYQAEIAGLKQNLKELESTASQDQILKIEKLRASGKLVKSVRLNYYENKLILGWRMTSDDVYVDSNGKEVSLQKTELTFEDKSTKEIPQVELARRKMQREYEVVEERKDREGNVLFTVMTDGGKEVTIDSRFVN